MKFKSLTVFLLIILVISLIVRLARLDYPLTYIFAWGDGTRDYFIADHILRYKEFPLLGPFNLLNEIGVYNSPLYYYLLAFFLIPYNHVLTLGIVNILFQLFTIFLIYLIAKKIFDKKTAILSILIFSFNPEILAQSDYIWQPHVSQTFAYLALFLAVSFYLNGRYKYLYGSALSLAFSFALHNSTFPWIPLFLAGYFLLLKRQTKRYLGVLLSFFIFLLLLHIPVGLYYIQNNFSLAETHSLSIQSINDYASNFWLNLNGILKAFNINNIWIGIISALTVFYFLKNKDKKHTKLTVFILLILILSPIFFASFFNKFRLHYLTLSLGVLAIFLGKVFTCQPAGRPFSRFKIARLVVVFLLLLTTTNNFQFLRVQKPFLENQKLVNDLSKIILTEIKDPLSFQIKSYVLGEKIFEYPILDTIFLIPLEDKLNIKLAILTDRSPFNHQQIGGTEYFVVACHEFGKLLRWDVCLQVFKKDYPSYAILKNLYAGSNIAIFLAKLH